MPKSPEQFYDQHRKDAERVEKAQSAYDKHLEEARKAGDLTKHPELWDQASAEYQAEAQEKFETWLQKRLKEQYESQKEILERVGILEKLGNGEMGIRGIDGKEYAFPKFREIAQRIRKNKEILETKTRQGFTKLLVVPFGMKLDDLIEKYKQVILKHHKEGELFAVKKKPSGRNELLEFNESRPVLVEDIYKNADLTGKLVYFPKQFTKQNHGGKTKKEILREVEDKQGGWQIIFVENLLSIPDAGFDPYNIDTDERKKEEKIMGGRPRIDNCGKSIRQYIETGEILPSSDEYLKALQNEPIYRYEQGMTPEDQLICSIICLEETNRVMDSYFSSIPCQLGAYFNSAGAVPRVGWNVVDKSAVLTSGKPDARSSDLGVRSAVRI